MIFDKIHPLKEDVGYNPQVVLRQVSEEFPEAKAIAVVVIDKNENCYVRLSDMLLKDLCFMKEVLDKRIRENL